MAEGLRRRLPSKKFLRWQFLSPHSPQYLRHHLATIQAHALPFYLCNCTRPICLSLKNAAAARLIQISRITGKLMETKKGLFSNSLLLSSHQHGATALLNCAFFTQKTMNRRLHKKNATNRAVMDHQKLPIQCAQIRWT
jgi:hypothetical protein